MGKSFKVWLKDLRKKYPSNLFDFEDTSKLEPLDSIIGQKRAVEAIDFGLNMKGSEYNIFVTGLEGTGKLTIVRDIVQKHALKLPASDDWCMVNKKFFDNGGFTSTFQTCYKDIIF